jgi:hypothetical protein
MLTCRFLQITGSPGEEGVGSTLMGVAVGDGNMVVPVGIVEQAVRMSRTMLRDAAILIRNIRTPSIINTNGLYYGF